MSCVARNISGGAGIERPKKYTREELMEHLGPLDIDSAKTIFNRKEYGKEYEGGISGSVWEKGNQQRVYVYSRGLTRGYIDVKTGNLSSSKSSPLEVARALIYEQMQAMGKLKK